jgi:DedD protein
MAWFKLGKKEVNLPDDAPIESVEALRNRAKYRLIGSVVLVVAGIVGFPMLFDSQPRTVAVDIPIEIPDKTKTKPIGGNSSGVTSLPAPGAVVEDKVSLSGKEEIVATGKAVEKEVKTPVVPATGTQTATKNVVTGAAVAAGAIAAGVAVKAGLDKAAADKAKASPDKAAIDKVATDKVAADKAKAADADKARKTAEAEKAKAATAEANRAKALLEGDAAKAKPAAATPAVAASANPPGTRYIVQFGAFSESAKAQEARVKVEKAGLKTYSQIAKTPEGERIRVRVGPFTSQAEADKAAAKIKALDLPAAILTL